jgi:small-conductance mechanosensitive channel
MFPGQTATPTPGVGVGEVVDLWPVAVRALWFMAGFLVVAIVGWLVVVPVLARAVRHRNPNNSTLNEAIAQYLRLSVVLLGLVIGTATAGYGRILADSALVVAAGTLALGVAGQTVLGSIVSGLVLVADPEFNVGDYIVWENGEGNVQSITLRVTRVLTPDGELVTVPNTILTEEAVRRPFGRGRYRVVERLDLAFDADVDRAIDGIEAAIDDVDRIADAPTPRVYVEEFGADTVTVAAHYWIAQPKQSDVLAVQSAFARAVRERLTDAHVDVSPPSTHELEGRIQVEDVGDRSA